MDVVETIVATVTGLGYEFVDFERAGRGLFRVYIDSPQGISVEDCATVSNQLTRVFAVEGIDYDRLEISSPGLDRPLKKVADWQRFIGEEAKVRLRAPQDGQRHVTGRIHEVQAASVVLDVEGVMVTIQLAGIDKANLVPVL